VFAIDVLRYEITLLKGEGAVLRPPKYFLEPSASGKWIAGRSSAVLIALID